jgi:alpha-tubulin suppressor-like RCC1 family protein
MTTRVASLVSAVTISGNLIMTGISTSLNVAILNAASGISLYSSNLYTTTQGTVNDVVAGLNHVLFSKKTGLGSNMLWGFGNNASGEFAEYYSVGGTRQTPVGWGSTSTGSSCVAFAAGTNSVYVIAADGTLYMSGDNTRLQLGIDAAQDSYWAGPFDFPVTSNYVPYGVTQLAVGGGFCGALYGNGTIWVWGEGNALGINNVTPTTPVSLSVISTATVVWAGCASGSMGAKLSDGRIFVWGNNTNGQLGVGNTVNRLTPIAHPTFTSAASISIMAFGLSHTAAVNSSKQLYMFGSNANGQLGVNIVGSSRLTPVVISSISTATSVSCGRAHTAVVLTNGTVWVWGSNSDGQLGINVAGGTRQTPVQISSFSTATKVTCGDLHTAVICTDGAIYTFGSNTYGQLGINQAGGSRQTPVIPVDTGTWIGVYAPAVCGGGAAAAPIFQLDLDTDNARKLTTSAWTTGSDSRIKTDVQTANLERCVDIINSLDLKYFKWNFPDGKNPSDTHSLGWIAQDVKKIFPKSVTTTPEYGMEDFHNLDSDQIIKAMYGALKKMINDAYDEPVNL